MTDVQTALREAILGVAPNAPLDDLDPDDDLREQLDIDSMDLLRIVQALQGSLGVDVPELDYPLLESWNGAVAYLARRVEG